MKLENLSKRIVAMVLLCLAVVSVEQATFDLRVAGATDDHAAPSLVSVLIEAQRTPLAAGGVSGQAVRLGMRTANRAGTEIDFSDPESGIFHIRYTGAKNAVQVWVVKLDSGEKSSFACPADGQWACLPLPFGPGAYTVTANPFDKEDRISCGDDRATFTLIAAHTDEAAPFRHANLYSDFDEDDLVVRVAQVLAAREEATFGRPPSDWEFAEAVVSFVYKNIIGNGRIAEERKAADADYYFPDIAATLEEGKGTCADKAALAAAMLKSRGIPVRIHYGYIERVGLYGAEKVYHAWLNVWLDGAWALYDPSYFPGEVTNEDAVGIMYLHETATVQ